MNVVKPDYIADLGPIDISILKSAVEKISPKLWQTEDASKENNFQCFHHTKHIIFRFIPGTHNPQQAYSNPIWLPWQGILLPILNKVAKHYNYHKVDFPKVMFAKLQSGFSIDRHIDRQSSNVLTHKIHVPIATNKDTVFIVNGKSFHLKEGHAYEVNNIVYHAVENRGETDRIHLIFEVYDISNKECLNEHSQRIEINHNLADDRGRYCDEFLVSSTGVLLSQYVYGDDRTFPGISDFYQRQRDNFGK